MIYDLDSTVKVSMFGKVEQDCGNWHNGRKVSDNIILYCVDGTINMKIENEIFYIQKGDLLLIPKKSFYKPLEGGSCQYYFFHFQATTLSATEDLPDSIAIVPHTELTAGYAYTCQKSYHSAVKVKIHTKNVSYDIRDIFEKSSNLKPNVSFSDKLLLDNFLRELLIHIGKNKLPHCNKYFMSILEYISEHFSESLSLSVLSEHFALSQSYICRLFKKELSLKPSEYINRVRISAAKAMLLETDMTITEIAEKSGYSDVYYFSRVFKKIIGMSPLKMRNENVCTAM